MNIFATHIDPIAAASKLCDQHIVKMPVETAQMLSTVTRMYPDRLPFPLPYKASHQKHGCNIWLAKSHSNWKWLIEHGLAMCQEYTNRYKRVHKSQYVIEMANLLPMFLPDAGLTAFYDGVPEELKLEDKTDIDKCIIAYRLFYIEYKSKFARWRYTNPPNWYVTGDPYNTPWR